MNRAQKIAWFNLVVILISLLLSGIAVAVLAFLAFVAELPLRAALGGLGFMGIMGLLGLTPFLFRKDEGKVRFDERDLVINRKAAVVAYSVFWVLFVAAAMVPWFIIGPGGVITVNYLPCLVFGGVFVVMLIQAIVTLQEYGWKGKGEKS